MARVTVEDCLEGNIDNLFQLVLVASHRARQIYQGSDPKVPTDNDKPTVIALREIAAKLVDRTVLNQNVVDADAMLELELENSLYESINQITAEDATLEVQRDLDEEF